MKALLHKRRYSFESRTDAIAAAKLTIKKLNSKGWKYKVWDNLGWHFNVYRGPLRMGFHWGNYSSLLSNDACVGGEMYWTDTFRSPDPNEVVDHQIELAKAHVDRCLMAIVKALGVKSISVNLEENYEEIF